MKTRRVEFYVLWDDRTWSEEYVEVTGAEVDLPDDKLVELAGRRLEEEINAARQRSQSDRAQVGLQEVGPLYCLHEAEEVDKEYPAISCDGLEEHTYYCSKACRDKVFADLDLRPYGDDAFTCDIQCEDAEFVCPLCQKVVKVE